MIEISLEDVINTYYGQVKYLHDFRFILLFNIQQKINKSDKYHFEFRLSDLYNLNNKYGNPFHIYWNGFYIEDKNIFDRFPQVFEKETFDFLCNIFSNIENKTVSQLQENDTIYCTNYKNLYNIKEYKISHIECKKDKRYHGYDSGDDYYIVTNWFIKYKTKKGEKEIKVGSDTSYEINNNDIIFFSMDELIAYRNSYILDRYINVKNDIKNHEKTISELEKELVKMKKDLKKIKIEMKKIY